MNRQPKAYIVEHRKLAPFNRKPVSSLSAKPVIGIVKGNDTLPFIKSSSGLRVSKSGGGRCHRVSGGYVAVNYG